MRKIIETSIICEPSPIKNRINEDACYFATDSTETLAAVIDGASQRIALPLLEELIVKAGLPERTTTAAFVAQQTRDFIKQNAELSPFDMIIGANQALRQKLESIINPLNAKTIVELLPQHESLLSSDPRLLRLMLPACVLTIAKISHRENRLSFAHAGDTALFTFHKNGDVQQVTSDQMGVHDNSALEVALKMKEETDASHLSDVLGHEDVSKKNISNGLYHNFVDEVGNPDKSLGVGVVDGLFELENYVEVGELDLENVEGVLLCSDGIPLPSPIVETDSQTQKRHQKMRNLIVNEGLEHYVAHLRQVEENDWHRDKYPRFKVHDDISAIFLRFS